MQGAVGLLTVQQLYHQNMSSYSTFVCACNDGVLPVTPGPPGEAQASISMAAALYLSLYLSHLIGFSLQRAETSPRLPLGLGTGYGGLERRKDGVGLIGSSFVQQDNVSGMSPWCKGRYRWALDSIPKLYDGGAEWLRR